MLSSTSPVVVTLRRKYAVEIFSITIINSSKDFCNLNYKKPEESEERIEVILVIGWTDKDLIKANHRNSVLINIGSPFGSSPA